MSLIEEHQDAIAPEHRFGSVTFQGSPWDLSHLEPFVIAQDVGGGLFLTVVVLFSCHCFTRAWEDDDRLVIPVGERFDDGQEHRILDPERYRLSQLHLPALVKALPSLQVRVGDRENFFIAEVTTSEGKQVHYTVFFKLARDRRRKKRLLLRVQSAFPRETLTRAQTYARKVRFQTLVRAIYEGRQIGS